MSVTRMSESELVLLAAELRAALPPLDADEQRIAVSVYRLPAEGDPVRDALIARGAAVPIEDSAARSPSGRACFALTRVR
ncbi:MAG: hypothetical protein ABI455_01995 [Candidatus Dormiibacterota bacterium]